MADPEQPNIIIVDVCENGYNNPPTKRGIKTLPIDPSNPPVVGGKVSVSTVKKQPYSLNSAASAGGSNVFEAKITNVNLSSMDPTIYQVDIFGNGYGQPATQTGVTAYSVDETSINFSISNQVVVFEQDSIWYVLSQRPFVSATNKTCGIITIVNGAGIYHFKPTVDTAGGALVGGAVDTQCKESNLSTKVPLGTYVQLVDYGSGWRFNMNFGTN